jgi:hypothetical protein
MKDWQVCAGSHDLPSNSRNNGITEAHEVRARIACEQHSSRAPQQRDLSRAMPGNMNDFDTASDGQYFSSGQRLVDGNRLHLFVGMVEQPAQHSPQQIRCRPHRPKRTATLGRRDIERVHVGPRTGFPHDRSGAADVIRVAVSENQVPELVRRTAKAADRPEDDCLLTRETGVDQCQPVVALDPSGSLSIASLAIAVLAVGHTVLTALCLTPART